ncbi:MAG: CHAT domain-containing protein [Ottowia sp.]|nr:CHAT domain-containing protein [Ottowia sp.]
MSGTRLGRTLRRCVLVLLLAVLFACAALMMAGTERLQALMERTLGPGGSPVAAAAVTNLAKLYHKRTLATREKQLGAEHPDVAESLNNLAEVYFVQARYADAEPLYKRALAILEKQLGAEHIAVANTLDSLASMYHVQNRYTDAEPLYKRALEIKEKALGAEHPSVASGLTKMATMYIHQARYAEAEQSYMRSLEIIEKKFGTEHPNVALCLNNLAALYDRQARYADAEPLHKRALAIREKQLGAEHPNVALSLNNLAGLYRDQARYAEAEPLYKRALAIFEKRQGAEHPNVALSLNNLAALYVDQGRYAEAEPLHKRALEIREKAQKALGTENPSVARSLNNLATLHFKQGHQSKAEPLYKRALPIAAGSGEPDLLWSVPGNLRDLYEKSSPNLSAFYGKRAVNTLQAVRETNMAMEAVSQRSFLKSKQEYYNKLADLLFAQNRLAEGQQVLAMLKEAEYRDFVGKSADAADDPRRTRVAYSPREAKWEQRFQDIAAKLAKADPKSTEFAALANDMDAFFEDVKRAFADDASGEVNRLDNTSPMQQPLAQLGEGTVLVQYLMPQERLWLLITTKDGMKAQQVDIKASALADKVAAFQSAIVAKSPDVNTLGKELHGLLIAPAAEELKEAKTLMLAPDGALRYLPFAALHDGEKYLAQRYVLSNYTDMSKDRITDKPTANWSFAGFGVSKKVSDLHALPAVAGELAGIRANALDGTVRLDGDFTRESLRAALNSPPPVVHVASHFVFEKRGNEQASYLLLGDGGKLTLADIRKGYRFNNVDLVALSACNTGVGGEDKDGHEVEGLGVLVQRQGAKGVLASLWEVADESTGQFMQLFYSLRQRQGLSKAEALQKTQLAFIEGRVAAELTEAARARGRQTDAAGKTLEAAGANHPYYWAPFILMGNWL